MKKVEHQLFNAKQSNYNHRADQVFTPKLASFKTTLFIKLKLSFQDEVRVNDYWM